MSVPSSECCQTIYVRNLNKKGTENEECKAQSDYLLFNELFICVCVCVRLIRELHAYRTGVYAVYSQRPRCMCESK